MGQSQVEGMMPHEAYAPSQVSWGAISAGWFLAAATALVLYIFGSAAGLGAINTADAGAVERGIPFGTVIWVFVTWAISMYIGGFFASWVSGKMGRMNGLVHGACAWAMTSVMAIILGLSGFSGLLQLGPPTEPGMASVGFSPAGASAAMQSFPATVKEQMKQILTATGTEPEQKKISDAINRIDERTTVIVSGQLIRGDAEGAKNTLSANSDLSQGQIDEAVSDLSLQAEQYMTATERAFEKLRSYTAAALWIAFFSSLIGLLSACFGGVSGCRFPSGIETPIYAKPEEYEKRKERIA